MKDPNHKAPVRTLTGEAREATLDMAAAALAAIHTGKQVAAQSPRPSVDAPFGLPQPTLPFGLGDLLFGAAQLQVDFARRLFEFNRAASNQLRSRLRQNLTSSSQTEVCLTTTGQNVTFRLTIRNRARVAKQFQFSCSERCTFRDPRAKPEDELKTLTIGGDSHEEISVEFKELSGGLHQGEIAVISQGIKVETIPYRITVSGES